jgi:hypothetical protein
MKRVTTADVAEAVEAKESGWDFTPGVCTCPPLVKGQKSQSVGTWEREAEGGGREVIFMDVYEIGSAEEAAEWMKGFDRRELGSECRVEKQTLGMRLTGSIALLTRVTQLRPIFQSPSERVTTSLKS